MFSLLKKIVKGALATGAVVALVGVGAAMIAGPGRARAVLHQMQTNIHSAIDQSVDDPTALRTQLEELQKEFPERIAQVRSDLAELNEQIRQLERDRAISEKVVALADRDLSVLEPRVSSAAAGRVSPSEVRLAAVEFNDHVMSFDRAHSKLAQIRQTRVTYQNRANDAEHDLLYLHQQGQRLEELLLQLETERAEFQAQLTQLERQVDAVARNQRLIEMLDKRNQTIQECSRYESASRDQLSARFAEIRSRQEAELEVLANAQRLTDYEQEARFELDAEGQVTEEQGTQDSAAAGLSDLSYR
jgi:predicted RNase H-like nuclease (RuvC/YqgF family)